MTRRGVVELSVTRMPTLEIPTLPDGWSVQYLPAGITRGLTVATPTLYIGLGPRQTSIITDVVSDALGNAVNIYADCAFWNVCVRQSSLQGIQIQEVGHKVFLSDCRVEMNAVQGAHGDADWWIERCYFQANGTDPNHDHNTYLLGKTNIQRSLFYHAASRSLGLGTGAPPYPTGTIDHCVIVGLDSFYGTLDLYPTIAVTNSTIIGAIYLAGGATTPSSLDGNYVDSGGTWSQATRVKYAHAPFRFYFPISDTTPYGAYPYDAQLTYPIWSSQYWAQSMCYVWWNPAIGQPFYAYYPQDDIDEWEAFMNLPTGDAALTAQFALSGNLANLPIHLAA